MKTIPATTRRRGYLLRDCTGPEFDAYRFLRFFGTLDFKSRCNLLRPRAILYADRQFRRYSIRMEPFNNGWVCVQKHPLVFLLKIRFALESNPTVHKAAGVGLVVDLFDYWANREARIISFNEYCATTAARTEGLLSGRRFLHEASSLIGYSFHVELSEFPPKLHPGLKKLFRTMEEVLGPHKLEHPERTAPLTQSGLARAMNLDRSALRSGSNWRRLFDKYAEKVYGRWVAQIPYRELFPLAGVQLSRDGIQISTTQELHRYMSRGEIPK